MAHFGGAVLLLAALNVLAALLNLGEFYLGLPKMLELVRNGGYAMFDAYEEAGLMRIQGTLSETSGFAAMTLPLFAFSFSLWLNNQRPLYAGPIAFMSVLLLVMSTSGTAYTSLAAYLVGVGIVYLWRAYLRRRSPRLLALSVGSSLFVLAVSAAFIFEVPFTVKVTEFLQHTVFSKLESKSGVERSMWNAQCWANFLDTYGIGVGLGTARASSYPLVLLSNVGLLGTGLFLAFLGSTFRGSNRNPKDQFVVEASRYALFAQLLTACISGAVFDLGVAFYAFAAAANVRGVVTRKLDATGPEHFTPDSGVVQT